tara:strand:+ start:59 stop:364 length:306 start_codon:yes stop_codon:yes gene_type:complete
MKHPQQAKGAFMMAPGNGGSIKSAQNSPGPFREDSSAMMFFGKQPEMKHPMDFKGNLHAAQVKHDKDGKHLGKKDFDGPKPQMGHSNPQLGGMLKPNDYHK